MALIGHSPAPLGNVEPQRILSVSSALNGPEVAPR